MTSAGTKEVVVLTPLFNDWASLSQLLVQLDGVLDAVGVAVSVLVVDDGSTTDAGADFPGGVFRRIRRVEVLRLRRNMGHQRAIAVGLSYVEANVPCDVVVVMDSDGEDDPRDVPRLLQKAGEEGWGTVVFAERTRRSESLKFRVFYALYKALHYALTSKGVRVGNFSAVPGANVSSLVAVSELWSHYAAAVYKSRQPIALVPTVRAARLDGSPKMNFVGLVVHGLSAMAVYSDTIGVRLMVAACVLAGLAVCGIAGVVGVKLFTALAIPGWATVAVGTLMLVLLQAIMLSLAFSFIIISGRDRTTFLPCRDYHHYVGRVTTAYQQERE